MRLTHLTRTMSHVGTNRTNRAGLLMSVDRGRPEVSGRQSKRRDRPKTDLPVFRLNVSSSGRS